MPPSVFIQGLNRVRDIGIFRNYAGSDVTKLRRMNLVYGFNGSGKTTISRMLASVAAGTRHSQLPETGTFEFILSNGARVSSTRLGDNPLVGNLLVFNADFVEENLKWKEGTSTPIFYLGADQATAAASLEEAQGRYGRVSSSLEAAVRVQAAEARSLQESKRSTARTIAEQLALPPRQYEAPQLAADYSSTEFSEAVPLEDGIAKQLRSVILMQEHLPRLDLLNAPSFKLRETLAEVREVVDSTVGSIVLDDLKSHDEMLGWVKRGLDYHSSQHLRNCLFCGGAFGESRELALRALVNSGFDKLMGEIGRVTQRVSEAQRECIRLKETMPSVNDLSPDARVTFERDRALHKSAFAQGERYLTKALALLAQKAATPSATLHDYRLVDGKTASEWDIDAASIVTAINGAIIQHNTGHDNFGALKENAKRQLKGHYLAKDRENYRTQLRLSTEADARVVALTAECDQLKVEVSTIQKSFRKHGPAADVINKLLINYLGRSDIELVAADDAFQIKRDGVPIVGPLSEGEKTAIALCYFLASVQAEGRKVKDLIVVVDDPISSLDSRSLNYAFNFLRGALGGAGQLIILTHNLHFMNEVKKWMKPLAREEEGGKTPTASLLFLEATQADDGIRSAAVIEMPRLIRDYESEYHHLFSLVWKYGQQPDAYGGYFYLLPNALRKILEVFLSFHFPGASGLSSKITQAVGEASLLDRTEVSALERLAHVESHGDSLQDLVSLSPLTLEETRRAVLALFKLIRTMSPAHFTQMDRLCRRAQ